MRSKLPCWVLAAALAAAGPAAAGLEPGDYPDQTLVFDGVERSYDLLVPASYDGTTAIPLVVDMHGFGSNSAQQRFISGIDDVAEAAGFAVVWPDGLTASWNAGFCCGQSVVDGVHDVAFLRTLVDAVAAELAIDRARVYATGLSNGGAMTQRLACEAADTFAAAAAMAFPIGVAPLASCVPSRPIAVLTVQTPTDELVPYEGSVVFPSAAESFAHWRATDGCGDGPPDQLVEQGESRCEVDTTCADGVEVGLCTVASTGLFGGHVVYWTEDFELAQVAWDFMSRFALPGGAPPLAVPAAGKKLALKDDPEPAKRKLELALRDDAVAPSAGFDPTAAGATLVVYNANGTGEQMCLALPAQGWRRKGDGFVYKDAKQLSGPCKSAKVAAGRLDASCLAKNAPLSYSLDEPSQGGVAARFESGGEALCALFGGTVQKDQTTAGGGKAAFQAKDAPAPPACPALVEDCPSPP